MNNQLQTQTDADTDTLLSGGRPMKFTNAFKGESFVVVCFDATNLAGKAIKLEATLCRSDWNRFVDNKPVHGVTLELEPERCTDYRGNIRYASFGPEIEDATIQLID